MSVGTAGAWPGGSGSDLLACAADLRWGRPDLVAEIAEHVAEIVADDDLAWVEAVGWLVHGRSAIGDGRECATAALAELRRRSPGLWDTLAAARLRVEVALLAVGAGQAERAKDIATAILTAPAPADVRADAFGVLARCTADDRPGSVDEPARRAEVAWAEVGGPYAETGAASVALVAAAALRRAGRASAAIERAAEGLSRLDHVRGARSGSPSRHLAAALAAEWIGSLLDAGRADDAREGCGPLAARLQERARPSRQVALLRLTVARAMAGPGDSSAGEALGQAAADAAAADTPDLEAVCLSTLGMLHEQSGRLDSALDAVRRGVEAHRSDAARRDRFVTALRALPAPAESETWTPPWDAEPSDSPIADLVARTLGTSLLPPVLDEPPTPLPVPQPSAGPRGRSGVEPGPAAARPDAGTGPDDLRSGRDVPGPVAARPDDVAGRPDDVAGRPDDVAGRPSDGIARPDGGTGHDDPRSGGAEPPPPPAGDAPHVDDDPLFGAFWQDPAAAEPVARAAAPDPPPAEAPAVNGSSSGTGSHPLAGSPWSTGRWSSVRPHRAEAPSQQAEAPEPEPEEQPAATLPVAAPPEPLSTEGDGWLQAALAELDRVWGTAAGPAPDPVPPDVAGCVVVVDILRAGEPVPSGTIPEAASVIEEVAVGLEGALPAGARLRRVAEALSVVMPSHDHAEAGEWMHRALPPVFAACVAADDEARLAIRAAVHDVDGPVGAQLIHRLGVVTSRRAAGRHDATAGVAFPPPLAGSGGRRRRAEPEDEPVGGAPAEAVPNGDGPMGAGRPAPEPVVVPADSGGRHDDGAPRTASAAPAWMAGNTEGLGIADLLAGALAAYRSI